MEKGVFPGTGDKQALRNSYAKVRILKEKLPGLVIALSHDFAAKEDVAKATGLKHSAEIFGNSTMAELFPAYEFSRTDPDSTPVASMTVDILQLFGGGQHGGSITIKQLTQHTHGMPDVILDDPAGDNSLFVYQLVKYAAGKCIPLPHIRSAGNG